MVPEGLNNMQTIPTKGSIFSNFESSDLNVESTMDPLQIAKFSDDKAEFIVFGYIHDT